MVDAFVDAAEKLGHEVTRFDAAFMKIGGCHACETCYSAGKACGFNDDFNTIAPAILEADVLVFATPVNWYSIPAQIKAVIDRIYSLVVGGKDIAGKECALIACCEEEDPTVLDGVRVPMERNCALNKWDMVGEVLVPGVLNKDDIEKTYRLRDHRLQSEQAYKSGVSRAGRSIEWHLHDPLGLPIPAEEFYRPHFRERCETCGQRLICNGCSDCGRCA